jgi:hypothetical protein
MTTMTDRDDRLTLESVVARIVQGVPPPSGDRLRRIGSSVVWETLLAEAILWLLGRLADECVAETPASVQRRARAIRDRNWLNFGLRRAYNAIWYQAEAALKAKGVEYEAEDVYALADRTIDEAANSDVSRIEACLRALRS